MWNRGGEGVALLMMIMPSVSITFSNYFSGILFTLLRQVAFAEEAEAELETEGEKAALGVDVDNLAGMLLFIVHSLAAAGDTVFQLDIRGDHCGKFRPFCLGYDDCTARVKGRGSILPKWGKWSSQIAIADKLLL